jgi:hypothetical protein
MDWERKILTPRAVKNEGETPDCSVEMLCCKDQDPREALLGNDCPAVEEASGGNGGPAAIKRTESLTRLNLEGKLV